MPSKRTPITHEQVPQVSPAILSLLSEGLFEMPENSETELLNWDYFTADDEKAGVVESCRDFILAEWQRQRPGRRPAWWWLNEAPEKKRRRLGGVGDPEHEFLAIVEKYDCGIPRRFVQQWAVDYYNGRARDIHGNPIGREYKEGHFRGRAIDPKNPPAYESEATYLQRHGLLTAAETRQLTPEDFAPEIVGEL